MWVVYIAPDSKNTNPFFHIHCTNSVLFNTFQTQVVMPGLSVSSLCHDNISIVRWTNLRYISHHSVRAEAQSLWSC